jgi:hypothetical protein
MLHETEKQNTESPKIKNSDSIFQNFNYFKMHNPKSKPHKYILHILFSEELFLKKVSDSIFHFFFLLVIFNELKFQKQQIKIFN